MPKQFLTFLAFGSFALLINFIARLIINLWLSFSLAIVIAQIIAMFCAYFLFRTYVFNFHKDSSRSFFKFLIINLISLFQVWAVSYFLAYVLLPTVGISEFIFEISHIVGISSTVLTSFIGHKFWTFNR
jgi:putative flippase GtrA